MLGHSSVAPLRCKATFQASSPAPAYCSSGALSRYLHFAGKKNLSRRMYLLCRQRYYQFHHVLLSARMQGPQRILLSSILTTPIPRSCPPSLNPRAKP